MESGISDEQHFSYALIQNKTYHAFNEFLFFFCFFCFWNISWILLEKLKKEKLRKIEWNWKRCHLSFVTDFLHFSRLFTEHCMADWFICFFRMRQCFFLAITALLYENGNT